MKASTIRFGSESTAITERENLDDCALALSVIECDSRVLISATMDARITAGFNLAPETALSFADALTRHANALIARRGDLERAVNARRDREVTA
jgi:hypothetical protein